MKNVLNIRQVRAYVTQFASISSSAPRNLATGSANTIPSTDSVTPSMNVRYIIIENPRRACSSFFSPRHFATSALPPVPIMNPTPPSIIRNGITRFTEANAVLPTKFDTKYPSTTPYIDVKTIITIDGRQNRMSRGSVK